MSDPEFDAQFELEKKIALFRKKKQKSVMSNEKDCNNYWIDDPTQCKTLAKNYYFPSLTSKLLGEKISFDYESMPSKLQKSRISLGGSRKRRRRRRNHTLKR
jgi:hypothetical protein